MVGLIEEGETLGQDGVDLLPVEAVRSRHVKDKSSYDESVEAQTERFLKTARYIYVKRAAVVESVHFKRAADRVLLTSAPYGIFCNVLLWKNKQINRKRNRAT